MADCEPIAHQFMHLTVPEYAYMFGFLQADGHLAQGPGQKGRLTVEISARDIEILHEFRRLTPYYSSVIERTRSTNFAKTHTSAIWTLCALAARTRLNELGLPYGSKSKGITPPCVPFSSRDYVRGLIDADGSVGFTAQGWPFISLTTASEAIYLYFRFYAQHATGVQRTLKRNARDGIYNILYTKESAQKLAAQLYYSKCLSMKRKQAAADSLASWSRPVGIQRKPGRIEWTQEKDEILLAAPTIAHAAVKLGHTANACQARRWRLLHDVADRPN
ncbi:LAGLIDADG family homing endonuclease [Streptomyces sp. NPDC059787]|uniref:LAGLIDADG family homing endonuclease n=1 Tax=Streptomyces sp. NPDC059787 TaxID=3346947 RepID=UPI00365C998A